MGFFICPLVPYFPTFSTTNLETTCTFEKTKSLCTFLQVALTLLRNQNWPRIPSFPQVKKKTNMISKFEKYRKSWCKHHFLNFWIGTKYSMLTSTPICSENTKLY
jgi:hypothetical protein